MKWQIRHTRLALAGVIAILGLGGSVAGGLALHAGSSGRTATLHGPGAAGPLASSTPSTTSSATPSATPTPSASPPAQPTASPKPAPPPSRPAATPAAPVSYFKTLPPGSALASDAQCAREIASNPWEPRPGNRTANQTNVYVQGFRLRNSYLASYGSGYEGRVTGNFTGTTDQILRWGACKWGFDENSVRAQAVVESSWQQSTLGDCGVTTQAATHGCASVGILQVKGADIPATHPGTWPAAWTSTAFNVDYTLAVRRLCYDGKEAWLKDFNASYAAGDLWGCIGRWYSGRWHDAGANQYIQKVQAALAAKSWTTF